jgi:hypothetical protein
MGIRSQAVRVFANRHERCCLFGATTRRLVDGLLIKRIIAGIDRIELWDREFNLSSFRLGTYTSQELQ